MAHTQTSEAVHAEGHASGRQRPVYDDINVSVLVLVGIISTIVTFLIIAFVQGLAYHMENSYLRATASDNYSLVTSADVIKKQKNLLDGSEGGAAVPINQAMDLVVREYSKNQAGAESPGNAAAGAQGQPAAEGAGH